MATTGTNALWEKIGAVKGNWVQLRQESLVHVPSAFARRSAGRPENVVPHSRTGGEG